MTITDVVRNLLDAETKRAILKESRRFDCFAEVRSCVVHIHAQWVKYDAKAARALIIWHLLVVLWAAILLGALISRLNEHVRC